MMIKTSSIEQVVNAIQIEQLIGKFTPLKKAGANFTGLCPFHDEKTGSFSVSVAKDSYKCFGCGVGGKSGVSFIMKHQRLSWIEAIKYIADFYNIQLEYEEYSEEKKKVYEHRERLFQCNELASKIYHEYLMHDKLSKPAMEYLFTRKFLFESVQEFNIGFAPNESKFLTRKLIEAGFLDEGIELGLVKTNSQTGDNYDCFRNRIMFPITEERNGRVVGFGGRTLSKDKKEAKYINSPENALYSKKNVLYGFYESKQQIVKEKRVFITEGYMDVTSMHATGINTTVASCGTALTVEHVALLKKFADEAIVVYDSDNAGINAFKKALPILLENDFRVKFVMLPNEQDPNDFCYDNGENSALLIAQKAKDGITAFADMIFAIVDKDDAESLNTGITALCDILSHIKDKTRRNLFISKLAKQLKPFGVKETDLRNVTETKIEKVFEMAEEDSEQRLPEWVDSAKFFENGFIQREDVGRGYKVGIYFRSGENQLSRLTNFTVNPLFQIVDMNNGRRLIEIWNGMKRSVVELPNRAFIDKNSFEVEMVNKGNFCTEPDFGQKQFKRMVAWLLDRMPQVYELRTLGWQSEGFFAFSNMVYGKDGTVPYNEYGIVSVGDRNFLSPGKSKALEDERDENNPYENDLYLKFVQSKYTFKEWAELFSRVYGKHAPFGIAFVFISIYKDIVTKITKCPHLYCHGPKGAGKSAMAESIMWLFFSGKNAEGKLIQGYNLNPGQGTPFSFFNSLGRFKNLPRVYNEYDPNTIEFWKKGIFKSAYDGEGREVGSGESGKKRKTEIQKVQGTCILAGQFLDTTDDGSVLSRSIPLSFSLEENTNRTDEQKADWKKLNEWEYDGLSSIVSELLSYREHVKDNLKDAFWAIQKNLSDDMKAKRKKVEQRVISNYSLALSITKVMSEKIQIPLDYNDFYKRCFDAMVYQADLLKDTGVLTSFWKAVEYLVDTRVITEEYAFKIDKRTSVQVWADGKEKTIELQSARQLIFIRLNLIYNEYAKDQSRSGRKNITPEATLFDYLKDQDYFIGSAQQFRFKDKKTSCYVLDYEKVGVDLQREFDHSDLAQSKPAGGQSADFPQTVQLDAPF